MIRRQEFIRGPGSDIYSGGGDGTDQLQQIGLKSVGLHKRGQYLRKYLGGEIQTRTRQHEDHKMSGVA